MTPANLVFVPMWHHWLADWLTDWLTDALPDSMGLDIYPDSKVRGANMGPPGPCLP